MNAEPLQQLVDQVRAISLQRWLLGAAAIVAAIAAAATTSIPAVRDAPWVIGLVGVLALAAAAQPDSTAGTIIVALVLLRWVIVVDDVTTAWSLVVATCLLVFHGLVALLAVVPPSATIDRSTLARWSARTGVVAAATGGMWTLIVALDRWPVRGGAVLTLVAFVTLAAGAVALLARTHPSSG